MFIIYITKGGFFMPKKKRKSFKYYNRQLHRINYRALVAVACLISITILLLISYLIHVGNLKSLKEHVAYFAIPQEDLIILKDLTTAYSLNFSEVLATYYIDNSLYKNKAYSNTSENIEYIFIKDYDEIKKSHKQSTINYTKDTISLIMSEMKVFPINNSYNSSYMFGDNFTTKKQKRNSFLLSGTNIFDRENISGRIPVVSATEGVIAFVGYNNKLGNHVSITTDSGTKYTYANLDGIPEGIKKGDAVNYGHHLGFIGSSIKSLSNQHAHLHFAIKTNKNFEINPFSFLTILESN